MIARLLTRCVLFTVVLLPVAAWSAPPTLDTAWGTSGTAAGELLYPGGIADGPDATVFVADTGNDRIQRFAADGAALASWDGTDGGGTAFDGPTDVAVDAVAGEVYVVDAGNDRVGVYTIDGEHVRDLAPADGFDWPYAVALDTANGTVWVSDMNGGRLVAFPSGGGDQAYGTGEFTVPAGIAVAGDGDVYVADKNNQRVALLDVDTDTVSTFSTGDGVVGPMVEPFDIEVDAFGRVHVLDAAYDRIREYAPDGTLADTWSSQASADGQIDIPRGLTITDGDIAHVADYGDDRIERYIGLNNAPTVTGDDRALLEDASTTFDAADFTDGFSDADGHAPATFRLESAPAQGVLTHDGQMLGDGDTIRLAEFGQITYTPPADFFGNAGFTWNLSDSVAWAEAPASTSLTVAPVNDAPSFTVDRGPPPVEEDSGEQVVTGWLSTDPGALNESGQTLTFTVSNISDPAAFTTQPTVAPDSGILTYEAAPDANGDFTFDLQIRDSGGSANGGDPVGTTVTDIPLSVTPVNDLPTFAEGSRAAITIDEDGNPRAFSLELNADDVESDPITWGIGTAPAHGTASVTGSGNTRQITYQPDADYNGPDAFTVVIADPSGTPVTFAVDLTIDPVNDPPAITGTPPATVAEDTAYGFTPTVNDPDAGDEPTLAVAALPSWANFDSSTGAITGTPDNGDVGLYPGITITATDGSGASATLGPFAIEVTNVNDAPVITNTPPAAVDEDSLYTYTPVVDDPDAGDTTRFTIDNQPPWATFDTATGALSGTPGNSDVGDYTGITISVADAEGATGSVGPFSIRVAGVDDPPTVTAPPDITVDAAGLYTRVDLERDGAASASDEEDGTLMPEPVARERFPRLRPGTHEIIWAVTDSNGQRTTAEQRVDVRPLVGIGPDQIVQEGTTVALPIELNGNAIDGTRPRIEFAVVEAMSSATGADHDLVGGTLTIVSGRRATLAFDVLDDGIDGEGPETLVIELTGTGGNTAVADRSRATITIVEDNTPPIVRLEAAQGANRPAVVIDGTAGGGPVTVTASTNDATDRADMRFDWNGGAAGLFDLANDADPATFEFDPTAVAAGVYEIKASATDDGVPARTGSASLRLRVVDTLAPLGSDDSDGDGIDDDDAAEGRPDRDGDGLPDYRDRMDQRGTVQATLNDDAGYLIETEPGLDIGLGPVAFARDLDGVLLSADDIASVLGRRDDRENVGGYFGFTIRGLPVPGGSVRAVIPQREPIPASAVYRKLGAAGGWMDFIEDGRNAIASTPGDEGFCPPPDAPVWTAGMTPGDWCVRVTIEDGGPNDADGAADGEITDPGGVARGSAVGEEGVKASSDGGGTLGPIGLLMLLFAAAGYRRLRYRSGRAVQ